ncbi:MAG: hypothetical protein PHQ72_14230 [Hespellia sp.]|nr:hypothetical protein [Hespellia sp.]
MTFDGAIIKEQGITFAIAIVKPSVLNSSEREKVRMGFVPVFGNIPIILASQDSSGRFRYNGRTDIVKFLSKLSPRQIPWKTYTVS